MRDVSPPSSTGKLAHALECAIGYIEWQNYIKYERVAEYHEGFPRYEPAGKPNKLAMKRANEIREMAGLPLVDYAKEYAD